MATAALPARPLLLVDPRVRGDDGEGMGGLRFTGPTSAGQS